MLFLFTKIFLLIGFCIFTAPESIIWTITNFYTRYREQVIEQVNDLLGRQAWQFFNFHVPSI